MKISHLVNILFSLNYVFLKKTNQIEFNLIDVTPKETIIGSLLQSENSQNTKISFNNVVLRSYSDLFKIDSKGNLTTLTHIDRDDICIRLSCCKDSICTIKMTAVLIFPNSISYEIILNIKDENDNRPTFVSPLTVINIPESAELQSLYKLPMAVDKDSPGNGIDRYSLSDPSNTFNYSLIHNEPHMTLIKPLDRETIEIYNLSLYVYEKQRQMFSNSLFFQVKVSDDNDNKPYFVTLNSDFKYIPINYSESFVIYIKENQTLSQEIYSFHALDNDEGENSKIAYSISSRDSYPPNVVTTKFSIESPSETAKIRLRLNLDYENQEERHIILVILATDNGKPQRSASVSLTINLLDINDNFPQITERSPNRISENDKRETVLKIFHVSDKDLISKDNISCNLSEESKRKFKLTKHFWDVYNLNNIIPFDYEKSRHETVQLICIDKAEPELTQTTNFKIEIFDENDNIPQWTQKEYHVNVEECSNSNKFIIKVNATDSDSEKFGKLYFNITEADIPKTFNFIRIDHQNGNVYLTTSIDRERFPQLVYNITVTDNFDRHPDFNTNITQFSNKTKLTIDIKDINDNSPRYPSQKTHFKIPENLPINSIVEKLEFVDDDEYPSNVVTLKFIESDSQTFDESNYWFGIVNNTIFVKNELNREHKNNITLRLQAEDNGSPKRRTFVNLHFEILDVNDNSPILKSPPNNSFIPNTELFASTEKNKIIAKIEADDPDYGLNSTLNYKILHSNLTNKHSFRIQKTGEILTNWESYETLKIGIFYLHISIYDSGTPSLSTNVYFYVNITSASSPTAEAYMSNIVILILIIVCSLALIVSLIAAIFWVRFRVSNDTPINDQEEFYEREHLNKENNQYSLNNIGKAFTQNSYENNRLNTYEAFQGYHHDSYVQSRNHNNYSHNTMNETFEKPILTACGGCMLYQTVPHQFNRLRHSNITDYNNTLLSTNQKTLMLQGCIDNDYKTIPNIQSTALMVEPNFSDSGKGGSVEDLNTRQISGISTFTNSSIVNTSSANAKLFCQKSNFELKRNPYSYDKSEETMF